MQDYPGLPSKEELKFLPIKYLAAFASRCAMRVRPLFAIDDQRTRHDKDISYEMIVDREIQLASFFASGKTYLPVSEISDAGDIGVHVAESGGDYAKNAAARSAFTASHAASTVPESNLIKSDPDLAHAMGATRAWAAGRTCVETMLAAGFHDETSAVHVIRRDFESLIQLSKKSTPYISIDVSDDGPIGPLWSDSLPPWVAHPPIVVLRDKR